LNRWQKLVEHAEKQTEQSAQSMAVLRQKIAGVEAQRGQMQAYREEYAQRAATPGTVGSVSQLNIIRQFGEQVQQTVSELDEQLRMLRERYEALRNAWNEHYKREQALKALQLLDEKKKAVKADRIQRREEDDFALLTRRRRDAG